MIEPTISTTEFIVRDRTFPTDELVVTGWATATSPIIRFEMRDPDTAAESTPVVEVPIEAARMLGAALLLACDRIEGGNR